HRRTACSGWSAPSPLRRGRCSTLGRAPRCSGAGGPLERTGRRPSPRWTCAWAAGCVLSCAAPAARNSAGWPGCLEVISPERLVFTWTWDGHEGHEGTQLIEVDFREREDGSTTVVLTNRGLRDEGSERSHREGWQASFDNLERVFAARWE